MATNISAVKWLVEVTATPALQAFIYKGCRAPFLAYLAYLTC